MAGAFSGRLLHSYYASQAMNPNLVTSGSVSFNPTMHGTPMPSFSFFGSQMPFTATPYANENMSEDTAMRIAALQVKLDQRLGPEYISQRQGPRGGPKLTYAEGWKIINLANEVFGFNGWSSSLVSLTTDFMDRSESGRYNVGVTAVVRVTLKEGVYHEDLGYGTAENSPSKGQALDKCKKEAVTDGLKRALRNFGNLMGNCLYDKAYTQEVVKLKVPPTRFDKSELHRRPEFAEENKPQIKSMNTSKPPVPPLNPNVSTISSTSMSNSTSREPVGASARNTSSSDQTSSNGRPSAISATKNTHPNISAQSAQNVMNQNSRPPPTVQQQHQRQQPQNRRVSFAENSTDGSRSNADGSIQDAATGLEPEDSFDFGDDDIFFAAMDMEEVDLGRPIETEADIGPPVDFEDSFLLPEGDATKDIDNASTADVPTSNISRNDKAAKLQRLQQEIMRTNSTCGPLHTAPPVQQSTTTKQPQDGSFSSAGRTSHKDSRSTGPRQSNNLNQSEQPKQPLHIQQRNHRPFAKLPQNQNYENPKTTVSNSGESGSKHSPTPSMGGFHFPPGMKPLQSHYSNDDTQQGGSSVGVKRSADVMSSNSNSVNGGGLGLNGSGGGGGGRIRGLGPGMGLQTAAPQQRREPFTPLEVGEGGDVKRLKR